MAKISELREKGLAKHWYIGSLTTPSLIWEYRRTNVCCFRVERMGKNSRSVGGSWRAFCGNALLTETKFKSASHAAAYIDRILPELLREILAYARVTIKVNGVEKAL